MDPRLSGASSVLQKPVPSAKLVAKVRDATGVVTQKEDK